MLRFRFALLALFTVLFTAEAFQPFNKCGTNLRATASSNNNSEPIIIIEKGSQPVKKNRMAKALTKSSVEAAIVRATQGNLQQQLKDRYGLGLHPIIEEEDWKMLGNEDVAGLASDNNAKTPWFFGMTISKDGKKIGLVSFYVAYSSWSGRILHLDQIAIPLASEDEVTTIHNNDDDDIEKMILRILASVAVDLQFARLTWRHQKTPKWHSEGSNHPEMHGEVLTLSMDQETMKNYIGESSDEEATDAETTSSGVNNEAVLESFSSATRVIDDCLAAVNSANSKSNFQLRLAKEEDLDTIGRLVQGLADYVKESDSVESDVEDYRLDGFSSGTDPLFTCLLLDHVNKDSGEVHTCGFAFCFFGYNLGVGRFLYLEDLFLEVDYRQNGGGNLLMKTLARICLAMQCQHLYWQALDWNTGGLQFYSKIGAEILEGEKTSRYCGDAMKVFAEERTA